MLAGVFVVSTMHLVGMCRKKSREENGMLTDL